MKKFYFVAIFIAFFFVNPIAKSQNLNWTTPLPTGTGNETIALLAGSILLNGVEVTNTEASIGVFYINDSGDYICGGCIDSNEDGLCDGLSQNYMDGNNIAIPAWGEDAGEDNGFETGETMNFFLHMDGIDYPSISITFASGDSEFLVNDMTVISEINFSEAQTELDPCSCVDESVTTQTFGNFCILPSGYEYCTDPTSDNYCNMDGYDPAEILNGVNNCIYGAVEGCTCPAADNYDQDATTDDGSCYMMEGCSDPLASNYSLTDCEQVIVVEENCLLPGCTCPEAVNFDPVATENDGSCVSLISICTDPTASNFNEGCENTTLFGAEENCDSGGCEVENTVWDYSITDANMTIQVGADVVLLNGDSPPIGSLLGVFFTNNNNELSCAGYGEWNGDQLAIAAWASESGMDNGFEAGDEITWLLYVGNQTFSANSITMNSSVPFSDTFISNGFGQLLSASFECEVVGVWGCTDNTAFNYDPNATLDDGSCYNLDWDYTITSSNMTILINSTQINAGNISLNGESIPNGSQIGIFYQNSSGELMCGGVLAEPWSNTSNSIAAWEAESGIENGFQAGDQINTFFLLIGDQVIPMDENGATMSNTPPFSDTFVGNGFGEILSVNFEGEYTLTYGCTDLEACNFDETAILDDESCYYGQVWYQDSDGDGLGNPGISTLSCIEISGFVTNSDDPCPNNTDNLNNTIVWYYDSDGDGLGETGDDGEPIYTVNGCTPPGEDFAEVLGDPCPDDFNNTDEDNDGICDNEDPCVGEYDVIGDCNGGCQIDEDNDGICDDEDSCVGVDTDGDGICDEDEILGCTDPNACNYNPNATDEITCTYLNLIFYPCQICEDGIILENDEDSDGICDDDEIPGCQDETACNYNPQATDNDNSSCLYVDGICDVCVSGEIIDMDADDDGICNMWEIAGCQDETACNYNPQATDNDNSCLYLDGICESCENGLIIDNDQDNDGVCNDDEIAGCQDETACNYNPQTTDNDNSCLYLDGICESCEDGVIIDNDQDNDEVCDFDEIAGCQDEIACNYNPDATNPCAQNQGQEIDGFTSPVYFQGSNYYISEATPSWTEANEICNSLGGHLATLTSEEEQNFVASLLDSNNSIYWIGLYQNTNSNSYLEPNGGWEWVTGENFNFNNWGDGEPNNSGDTGENYAFMHGLSTNNPLIWNDAINANNPGLSPNYSAQYFILEIEDCCTYASVGETCAGCTDQLACNYSPSSTIDDNSCIYPDGCTDSNACNFEPEAQCDDGSCIAPTTWYLDTDGDGLGFDSGDLTGFPFVFESCEDWSEGYADNADDPSEGDFDNDFIFTEEDCDDNNPEVGSTDGICESCENGIIIDNDQDDDEVCDLDEIAGCQDETACNYNPQATDSDNSCLYLDGICETCENGIIIDNDQDNDEVCDLDEIAGCQDAEACNYNPQATDNDNSCLYLDGICETCENGIIIDNDQDDDQVCNDDEIPGCDDSLACNYNPQATDNDNSCLYLDGICETCENGIIIDNDQDDDQVCNDDEIPGCDDSLACNYNPQATDNDNSCLYLDGICETCENGIIIDNDQDDDGVCNDDEIPGCTDPNACNFDPELGCTDDDGTCFYSEITIEYNTNPTSCAVECDGTIDITIDNGQPPYVIQYIYTDINNNTEVLTTGGNLTDACFGTYTIIVSDNLNCEATAMVYIAALDPDSDGDGVCDNDEVYGCTDVNACNYNNCFDDNGNPINCTEEDDSCEYCYNDDCLMFPIEYFDCNGDCWIDNDFDGICDELEVVGCDDDSACNYSMNVSESCDDNNGDGTPDCCEYPTIYYLDCDGNCLNDSTEILIGEDPDGICDELEIVGCQDDTACNYNPSATDPGVCEYPEDIFPEGVDADGNVYVNCAGCISDVDGDAVCDELEIAGCQDGQACNFNPLATDPSEGFPYPGDCYYAGTLFAAVDGVQNVSCAGDSNGAFAMFATGGNAPYTLSIESIGVELSSEDFEDGIFQVTNLAGQSYDVVITDINGCETLETVDIEEPNLINISIEYLNYISCLGDGDGSLTSSIQGGVPPYEFQWLDNTGSIISEEQDIFNLNSGAYALQVTDAIGCTNEQTFIVGEPNPLTIENINIYDVTCYDGFDGIIEVYITGGSAPYTYYYEDENGDTANPNQLTAGSYTVFITDDNGCELTDNFSIDQPNSPEFVDIYIDGNNEVCADEMATLVASEGFANYIWSETTDGTIFGDNDNTIELNESGEYMVTAYTDDGCEAISENIEIIVYENPIITINGPTEGLTNYSYTYYVDDIDGMEYEWSIQDSSMGSINGPNNENSFEITWDLQGSVDIYLTQTDNNGCSTTEFISVDISWPVSLEEFSHTIDFIVYPNPFVDYAIIEVTNPNNIEYNLHLYDLKGGMVKTLMNQTENKIKLNKEFSSGIYHLQLISSEGNRRKLIIVE